MARVESEIESFEAVPVVRSRPSALEKLRWQRVIVEGLAYLFLIVSGILMLLPLFWMIVGGFKAEWEVTAVPAVWLPSEWRWDNYVYVMTQSLIGTGYKNSLILVTIVTVISVATSVVGG